MMEGANRNQSQQSSTACFKCKSLFASLSALEIHLRSCDVDWEPPRAVPWTFIPPPDSLGSSGNGRGRGTGRGRGAGGVQPDRSANGSNGRGRGATQARGQVRGRGRGRGRGSADGELGYSSNSTGRGRGRRASSQSNDATDGRSDPSSPRGQRRGYQNARGQDQGQRAGRRSSTASNSSEASSPRTLDHDQDGPAKPTGPTCSKCQVSFANSQELVKHFNDSPAHPNSGFSPPSGSESSSRTSTLPALPQHWPTSGPSPCTKCNIVFGSPVELSEHFRNSDDHPDSLPIVGYRYGVPVFARPESPGGWSEEYLRREMQILGEEERRRRRRGDNWFEELDEEEAGLILELRQLGLW